MSAPIERAAEAFYEDPNGITSWSNMAKVEPDLADRYRAAMTRAFESIDVDELARVIHAHGESYDGDCDQYFGCSCGWDNGTDEHNNGYPEHLARAVIDHLTGKDNDHE